MSVVQLNIFSWVNYSFLLSVNDNWQVHNFLHAQKNRAHTKKQVQNRYIIPKISPFSTNHRTVLHSSTNQDGIYFLVLYIFLINVDLVPATYSSTYISNEISQRKTLALFPYWKYVSWIIHVSIWIKICQVDLSKWQILP